MLFDVLIEVVRLLLRGYSNKMNDFSDTEEEIESSSGLKVQADEPKKKPKEQLENDRLYFEDEDQEVDLDLLEPDEVVEELFEKINPLTIPSVIIGIVLLVISFTNVLDNYRIVSIFVGFGGGLAFVFGCSELIIFGVKGIAKKLNWSEYFMGIIAAIGADSSDIVVVTILLLRARSLIEQGNFELANNLTLTSITFVLTTVLINTLVLGVTMIVLSKKKPFKLPKELSETEANVVLAMSIFSFVLIAYGIAHNYLEITQFDQVFQGVMGASLLLFYIMFILLLIGDAKEKSVVRIGPQIRISEYFPECDEDDEICPVSQKPRRQRYLITRLYRQIFKRNENEEQDQFVAIRRFPWYSIIIAFLIGAAGIFFGGNLISDAIEKSIEIYNVPILVYCVVVGFVSSAPETTITLRALMKPEREDNEMGLVHQISSINQTFFLLFGIPFLFSSIIDVNIPAAFDTTLVFASIFAISLALHLTIIDDNHFDRVEGALILFASITSLLALAVVGGILT